MHTESYVYLTTNKSWRESLHCARDDVGVHKKIIMRNICTYFVVIATLSVLSSGYSETIPAIQSTNYKTDLVYLINWGTTVVGENYEAACKLLNGPCFWGIVPSKSEFPACYSPSLNGMIIGTNTWYCADGALAYYSVPANFCNKFSTCPNATWTLTQDGQHCSRPSATCDTKPSEASELQFIAAIVYGEASAKVNSYEEKAAIANALVNKRNAYSDISTVNELIVRYPGLSKAVKNKVERYQLVMCSNIEVEYPELYEIAANALNPSGIDYSNGACFWDGKDLKNLGSKQYHYKWGYTITALSHNVLSVTQPPPRNVHTAYGSFDYILQSTAGYGETIFWKYTQDFVTATRTPPCH